MSVACKTNMVMRLLVTSRSCKCVEFEHILTPYQLSAHENLNTANHPIAKQTQKAPFHNIAL